MDLLALILQSWNMLWLHTDAPGSNVTHFLYSSYTSYWTVHITLIDHDLVTAFDFVLLSADQEQAGDNSFMLSHLTRDL